MAVHRLRVLTEGDADHPMSILNSLRLLACILPLAAAGCLPIPWTKTVSPPMTGVYRRVDGTPAPGMRVIVSTAYEDECARPLLQTTTDSAGRFQLPVGRERQRWLPLQADLAWSWFTLCAGPPDSLRIAFHGSGWGGETRMECFDWAWRGRTRTSCGTPDYGEVLWGGEWRDGATNGWYRAITVRGDMEPDSARVVVQWLASAGPGMPATVRATAELPCAQYECRVDHASGSLSGGRPTMLRLVSFDRNGAHERRHYFHLGPPGQYRELIPR